jgi:Holliday junction resolvase RusA-like endonuclease
MAEEVLYSFHLELADPRPPSVNRLYRNGYRGRKVLSKQGEAFKAALSARVVEEIMTLPWKQAIEAVYQERAEVRLSIALHMPLYNRSWKPGRATAKGDLSCPYKKLDGSNYIKIVEDAIVAGTGIDDSAHTWVTVVKVDNEVPHIEVAYEILKSAE